MTVTRTVTHAGWQQNEVVRRASAGDLLAVSDRSQCVVGADEVAVIERAGKLLATLSSGKHGLDSVLEFGRTKSLTCDAYFIQTAPFTIDWRIRQPIIVATDSRDAGAVAVIGEGNLTAQVSDAWQFMLTMDARRDLVTLAQIKQRLDTLIEVLVQQKVGGAITDHNINTSALTRLLKPDFAAMGLSLDAFDGNLTIHPESDSLVAPMGYGDAPMPSRAKVAPASPKAQPAPAAKSNPEPAAPKRKLPSYGIGPQPRVAVEQAPAEPEWQADVGLSGSSTAMPDVMTVAQAAQILMVPEADVVAEIDAGRLKARRIGRNYRISKQNLETYLNG